MIIMPAMKMIVAQLMPTETPSDSPYQKGSVKMVLRLSVFMMASVLCMHRPNTMAITRPPLTSVTYWRSTLSMTIITNIARKITTAMICAADILLLNSVQ